MLRTLDAASTTAVPTAVQVYQIMKQMSTNYYFGVLASKTSTAE